MNYIISSFDCYLWSDKLIPIKAKVKYSVKKWENCGILFSNNSLPFILDFKTNNPNILKVEIGKDCYYILNQISLSNFFTTKLLYKSKEIVISLSSSLIITIDGEVKCEKNVENLTYSHFEIYEDCCLIYFLGKRNYLVVIKNSEVMFADYYDECNINESEKYFMMKLKDCFNHGKVCLIKNKEVSTYLVYLDDYDMELKTEFVGSAFLDCVMAKNFNYCNQLLIDELKMKDAKSIEHFFPLFDDYYMLNQNQFILTNKNTLAGIYEFTIENLKIININCR